MNPISSLTAAGRLMLWKSAKRRGQIWFALYTLQNGISPVNERWPSAHSARMETIPHTISHPSRPNTNNGSLHQNAFWGNSQVMTMCPIVIPALWIFVGFPILEKISLSEAGHAWWWGSYRLFCFCPVIITKDGSAAEWGKNVPQAPVYSHGVGFHKASNVNGNLISLICIDIFS